jgi:simple sugar transport system permease protein
MNRISPLVTGVRKHIIPLVFSLICLFSIIIAKQPGSFVVSEAFSRVTRNSILILSLIVPIICGMGLNFSIVLGAMAGQIGLIMITHWGIDGIGGIMIAMVIATTISGILGYLTGILFNRVKGQEMITGLILGFFATGVYDLIFMVMVGPVIPMHNPPLMIGIEQADGSMIYQGLALTINLDSNTKYALDNLVNLSFLTALPWLIGVCFVSAVGLFLLRRLLKKYERGVSLYASVYFAIVGAILLSLRVIIGFSKDVYSTFFLVKIPVATWALIVLVCLFIVYLAKTKLGQDIRAVGQNISVAVAAGIAVDRTRMIATILSTMIASWGQIVFLQNIGAIQSYYSHEQVGIYAVAAILVGGASIEKATISHVFTGALLFHVLFFSTPLAANNIFGNAQLGEFFRVFFCYGIIAGSLLVFALKKTFEIKKRTGVGIGAKRVQKADGRL